MKRILALLMAVVFLFSFFTGCTSTKGDKKTTVDSTTKTETKTETQKEETKASEEKILLMALPEPTGDKFSGMWGDYGGAARCMMFRRLLMTDKDLKPIYNDLASSHKVSDDGLTFTFTIRDDVKWHDGVAFTPEDVIWSIHMALKSTQISSIFANNFRKILGAMDYVEGKADSVKGITQSGNDIIIKMTEPSSTFLLTMAQWPPYPKHLLEQEPPETLHIAKFWEKPVGNGPYKVTQFIPGEYAILERFDDFYGEKPKIQKVKLGNIGEGDYVTKAQANELDYFMTRSLEIVEEVLKNPNYKAHPVDILYLRYLNFNMTGYGGKGDSLIADKRVREAILYAIDRESITNQLFPEQGAVLHSMVPTGMPEFNKDVKKYEYNPEKAKELLKEANFDFSKPLRITYYYNDQQTQDLMDAIVYYLGEVGIKVEHFLVQGDITSALYDKKEYDMCYAGFAPTCYEEIYAIFKSDDQTYIKLRPSTPNKFDPLIDELVKTTDLAKQTEIIKKLQLVENEYMWNALLFSLRNYVLVNESRLIRPGDYGHEWTNYDRSIEKWELK
jgi:peptide/nickel transport system substrate-binding protein